MYIPPKMYAAKTDIPCMLMDIPHILYERGAAPLAKENFNNEGGHLGALGVKKLTST